MSILFLWRPPSNSVLSQMSTISRAKPEPVILSPRQRMFELLCILVILAVNVSVQCEALIPSNLFAAIDIPIPVPQTRIPRPLVSKTSFATALAIGG